MDEMIYQSQVWLNNTYGDDSRFNKLDLSNESVAGKTGWTTIYALIRALQIELGIQSTADNFGTGTETAFNNRWPSGIVQPSDQYATSNVYGIIQAALWCKGYDPKHYTTLGLTFDDNVASAIASMKADAGLATPANGTVTLNVMKALLSMDTFKLLSSYGGKAEIRNFQQYMNRNYESYIGLMPCDGVYGRNTNKAVILCFQAEEGIPVGTANGNFGDTTKRCAPSIPYVGTEKSYNGSNYSSDTISRFVRILQFTLFCNGFGDGDTNGNFSSAAMDAVRDFQSHHAIPVSGSVNVSTWMSLFTSAGDTSRAAEACDCATILTEAKARTLANNGYKYVGRYLTGTYNAGISKALTQTELKVIFDAGLNLFPIYQTSARQESYFTSSQGRDDAISAAEAATYLKLPENTIIYFAVDFDAIDTQVTNSIIPYFGALAAQMLNYPYQVGIYGARNICSRVSNAGYAVSSFVGDMSTGYSGNLGYKIPDNWAFDQFATVTIGSGEGQIEIDKDGFSGRDTGVHIPNYVVEDNDEEPYRDLGFSQYGDGYMYVNCSSQALTVYKHRIMHPETNVWIGSEVIGQIPVNASFSAKIVGLTGNDYVYPVVFRNPAGKLASGYVFAPENDLSFDQWEEITENHLFHNYVVDNGSLVASSPTYFSGDSTPYYVYTLTDSSALYNSSGVMTGELKAGDQVAIRASVAGRSKPYLLATVKKCIDGVWSNAAGFVDFRFDLGVLPTNRLLK